MAKMREMFQDMIDEAERQANVPARRRGGHGLHFALSADIKDYTLSIARDDQYPSAREWQTVCDNFAYYIGRPDPMPVFKNGRYTLYAKVPKRQEMKLL